MTTRDSRTIDIFSAPPAPPPSVFSTPLARSKDPETSHAAAALASIKASPNRLLALRTLRDEGPLTDFELAARTGIQQTSIGKRRGECVAAGFVMPTVCAETGRFYTRPAPSGARATVWRITDAGLAFLRKAEAS